eukprot:TRINITY_DN66_c0_g2_i1.p1 TRINITY_DN66_c0_g2~~TRINITY_DN66_c0_g2_i1.p1  ORF type:complete len:357 (-),score=85.21 TRINITY_DN66_c0_g2_i1:333-1403(-)
MASPFVSHGSASESAAPQHILIPFDDSPTNVVYIRFGLALAKALHAKVTFMHVLESMSDDVEDEEHRQSLVVARKKMSERAQRTSRQLADASQVSYQVIESEGDPAFLITHFLCDLIVMGSHSRKAAERHTVGTVTDSVLQLSTVPVIAVRCPIPSSSTSPSTSTSTSTSTSSPSTSTSSSSTSLYRHILVAYDGTFLADNALLHVLPIARALNATLTLVYTLETQDSPHPKQREVVEGFLARGRDLCTQRGVQSDSFIHESHLHPAEALVDAISSSTISSATISSSGTAPISSQPFDLVVLGTHGRRGMERKLLGSVTEGVLRLANIPVFVVGRRNLHKEHGDQAVAANHALSID